MFSINLQWAYKGNILFKYSTFNTHCHNLIFKFPQNYLFSFKTQNKKIKKKLTTWQEQVEKAFKCMEKPNWDFWQKSGTQLYPSLKDNIDRRSN